MEAVIVIPARYDSSRFPGKPLAMIAGKSLLERTWRIAKVVKDIDEVYIATDDERILEHAKKFGAKVQITPATCSNGSERTLEALRLLKIRPDIVINLQGDAPLTLPAIIDPLVALLKNDRSVNLVTPATKLTRGQYEKILQEKTNHKAGGTFVTFDRDGNALYFSKSVIPFIRNLSDYPSDSDKMPVYKHIGLYGFRFSFLEKYVSLEPTPLEHLEGLEQLRVLENGMDIRVVEVDLNGRTHWSVDNPEDAERVEQIILNEGELVQ
jgi:3-deoxy-manno-octulosonate cytidylyltransferase (CMP-KDO synthetase)